MTIMATITRPDNTKYSRPFRSFLELAAWMEKNFGSYKQVDARQVVVTDMRQGKEQQDG